MADLRRVGGLRYNFDSEQPTLLDIETVDSVTDEKKGNGQVRYNSIYKFVGRHDICDGIET